MTQPLPFDRVPLQQSKSEGGLPESGTEPVLTKQQFHKQMNEWTNECVRRPRIRVRKATWRGLGQYLIRLCTLGT